MLNFAAMKPLYSMTGFGKVILQIPGKKINIEIKSLNSKQADINLRLPSFYRSKESEIRQMIAKSLVRGKIDCSIYYELTGVEKAPKINEKLASEYMRQLRALAQENEVEGDIISSVMRLPDVLQSSEDELSNEEWQSLEKGMQDVLSHINKFRSDEAARLKEDLALRLDNIEAGLEAVKPLEGERIKRVKERMQKALDSLSVESNQDRFEQELIYYLEKFDVTEEKVRLKAHLDYFRELMKEGGTVGKKLGFVGQEIGREINTMGSKANHADIQKIVVGMKDELEKIKEQLLNIL